jgi:hypothetical protein
VHERKLLEQVFFSMQVSKWVVTGFGRGSPAQVWFEISDLRKWVVGQLGKCMNLASFFFIWGVVGGN